MLFEQLFPQLPTDILATGMIVVGVLGAVLVTYSQFLEALRRRDLVRMVGAFSLFLYGLYIGANWILLAAFLGLFAASLIEFIEILVGIHRTHDLDSVRYKQAAKRK